MKKRIFDLNKSIERIINNDDKLRDVLPIEEIKKFDQEKIQFLERLNSHSFSKFIFYLSKDSNPSEIIKNFLNLENSKIEILIDSLEDNILFNKSFLNILKTQIFKLEVEKIKILFDIRFAESIDFILKNIELKPGLGRLFDLEKDKLSLSLEIIYFYTHLPQSDLVDLINMIFDFKKETLEMIQCENRLFLDSFFDFKNIIGLEGVEEFIENFYKLNLNGIEEKFYFFNMIKTGMDFYESLINKKSKIIDRELEITKKIIGEKFPGLSKSREFFIIYPLLGILITLEKNLKMKEFAFVDHFFSLIKSYSNKMSKSFILNLGFISQRFNLFLKNNKSISNNIRESFIFDILMDGFNNEENFGFMLNNSVYIIKFFENQDFSLFVKFIEIKDFDIFKKIQNDIIEYNQMNGNCEDIEQNLIDQKQKEIIDKINNEEKSENSLLFVISFNSLKNQKLLLEKVYPIESKSEEIT